MRTSDREKSCESIRKACYIAAKMTFILFLLFLQMSCGSASGTMSTPAAALGAAVMTVTPNSGSATAATSGTLSVTFTTEMNPATITDSTFQVSGPEGSISGTISYDVTMLTATFTPYASLLPGTEYTVALDSAIKDATGQALKKQTWSFKTGNDVLVRPSSVSVPSTFFGLVMHYADKTTSWPFAPFGTWRIWDAYVTWPWLEPTKGSWDFERLDKYMAMAEAHGTEVLLPLCFSPTWASARPSEKIPYAVAGSPAEPANIEDWKNYVRTVATRYKGRIHYYEIWNEPNLKEFYTGSVSDMVKLQRAAYAIIKEIDPSAQVLSPDATADGNGVTWLNQFLSLGGSNYADIIGYHFYVTPGPPEKMLDLISKITATMLKNGVAAKPLWNTESGWYIRSSQSTVSGTGAFGKVLGDAEASAYVARSYILNWAAGIERFFWYSWDNKQMGLVEPDGKTPKPSATAYAETSTWLTGAKMLSCGKNSQGIWIAQIIRNSGEKNWIVWVEDGETNMVLPTEWGAKRTRDLAGSETVLTDATNLKVSSLPLLVRPN